MSEKITEILDSLKAIKGVYGAALIEKFGLIKGASLPGWVNPEAVAAMVTLVLKASQRATKELEQGAFNNAILESQKGKILFTEVKGNILCVLASLEVKLGIVNLKLSAAKNALEQVL
ncbi:MAG: roadblock/LC7 domain-containing protein [Promethearchaeota archaeon]